MNDKSKLEQLKDELSASGKVLLKKGDTLSANIKVHELNDKIKNFNAYIAKTGIKHNHSAAIASVIRKNVCKKIEADVISVCLEDYLSVLTSHIEIYNNYINERINNRHIGIYKFPNEIIMMKYQTFFTNKEQAKENFDIIDKVKKKMILDRNNGKPSVYKVFICERDAKTNESKVIKVYDTDELAFSYPYITIDFTNDCKYNADIYSSGIYHKDNADSEDGKLKPRSNFKGVISVPVIPDFVIDEQKSESTKKQSIEEKLNDNNIEE
ncbi:hypothetical protein C7A11_26550 [Pseudomonas simiae]|uniref:hypothetical protein n=1 Tax=Pseudomonas simiae TaxID=321846 RepID=UPI000D02B0D5|nr:hypothetical protein [Pseudomonas simiae]PRW84351.1 hypothetical protein C7A11_26550 [Pseudomonas simiae]